MADVFLPGSTWHSWSSRFSWITRERCKSSLKVIDACLHFLWLSSVEKFCLCNIKFEQKPRMTHHFSVELPVVCLLGHPRDHWASWSRWTERRQGQSPVLKGYGYIWMVVISCCCFEWFWQCRVKIKLQRRESDLVCPPLLWWNNFNPAAASTRSCGVPQSARVRTLSLPLMAFSFFLFSLFICTPAFSTQMFCKIMSVPPTSLLFAHRS